MSGTPLDLLVRAERIYNDYVTKTWIGEVELGDVAVVSCGKTELILVSKRSSVMACLFLKSWEFFQRKRTICSSSLPGTRTA